MRYETPTSITDALALRAAGNWKIVAGGTDVFPASVGAPLRFNVLDVSNITELRGIEKTERHWRIGALATWTQLINQALPPSFNALKQSAAEVGSVQIQNAATIVGNLVNASPAADGVPPLLIQDAKVEISSLKTQREVPLGEFILGNRRTLLQNDELVTAIVVPRENDHANSHFIKLGARKYLVISIAMVAAQIGLNDENRISSARIAVGSCSEVATRLPELEKALLGEQIDKQTLERLVACDQLSALMPITDIRASSNYRMEAAAVLIQRAITCSAEGSASFQDTCGAS